MALDTLSLLRSGKMAGAKRLDLSENLAGFPREIFELADSLEVLNLSKNQLSSLPSDFSLLTKLRILFCSENNFRHLPAVLGECPDLSMIGFKSNQIETIEEGALPSQLRWLILTDNRIKRLPASIGGCRRLQKLMLSGNQLEQLPEAMSSCMSLELIRLAANRFSSLPQWLLELPKLAWLAIAGNPICATLAHTSTEETFDWSNIELQAKIGEGASGIVHRARWQGGGGDRPVAVKVFKGAMTSDGLPSSELAASLTVGRHENLMEVLGEISDHPEGAPGLVMPLIDPAFSPLAGPPSFDSCTRDVYAEELTFSLPVLSCLAKGVVSAARHLHARNITHSDLYAHNILWNNNGDCLLGDFGAACGYPGTLSPALERIEVRAFGYLLEELLLRCASDVPSEHALWALQRRCIAPRVADRPLFVQIEEELSACLPLEQRLHPADF
ncbi:MAG: protein kinase [Verrucomicrobiaceae bacterium]|nr:protein kinase [Verrucomicrobiaceae bacterium]MDB6119330.1 protein kinase [Verrucomicrobiaceae bacterium]